MAIYKGDKLIAGNNGGGTTEIVSKEKNGLVPKGLGQANKCLRTDDEGNPHWGNMPSGGTGGVPATIVDCTISADDADWIDNDNTATKTDYPLKCNTYVEALSGDEDERISVMFPLNDSLLTANKAGIASACETSEHTLTTFSKNKPTKDMFATILIFRQAGDFCKRFAECTWEEINNMIEMSYDGLINLRDYWLPGDTNSVYFAGTDATDDVVTSQPPCNMPIRITGFNHDRLVTPINGHTKAAVSMDSAYALPNNMYIWGKSWSLSNTDVWGNCPLNTWLQNDCLYALPPIVANNIKEVYKECKTTHTGTDITDIIQKLFFYSEYELYGRFGTELLNGNITTSNVKEGDQYEFYQISSNIASNNRFINNPTTELRSWLRSAGVRHIVSTKSDPPYSGYTWSAIKNSSAAICLSNLTDYVWSGNTYHSGGIILAWAM